MLTFSLLTISLVFVDNISSPVQLVFLRWQQLHLPILNNISFDSHCQDAYGSLQSSWMNAQFAFINDQPVVHLFEILAVVNTNYS